MRFIQPKVILFLTVLLEYLKLLLNTKAGALLASLVFLQCRYLPSPIQRLFELCMISSVLYGLYLENLKYLVIIWYKSPAIFISRVALQSIYHNCSSTGNLKQIPQSISGESFSWSYSKKWVRPKDSGISSLALLVSVQSFSSQTQNVTHRSFFFFLPVAHSLLNCSFFPTPEPPVIIAIL